SGAPGPEIPYSVSMPITLGIATRCLPRRGAESLQVLPRVDPFDLPALAPLRVAQQGANVHDALALLAGDPGPVVGVRRVGQVLVLLELVSDRVDEVLALDPLLAGLQQPLDGLLLGPGHDVLDHGAGVEVLEVQDLLVAGLVGDLEEPV